nr:hypothetical protein [Planosporangium flavigriseum]
MKDGVKMMLNGMKTPDITVLEPPLASLEPSQPNHAHPSHHGHPTQPNQPTHPSQAVQVLAMAQRTADEHVQTAQRRADHIRADALAAAEQIVHDAEVHAQNLRREADKVLADARALKEQAARDAQAHVEEAQRDADSIVSKSRAQAVAIAGKAEEYSQELKQQAQRRYDDLVGTLATKREGLQLQIEALERFDREYRARLTSFMQSQLRALWVDQPQVAGEFDAPGAEMSDEPVQPAQRNSEAPSASISASRRKQEPASDAALAAVDY